ncbi:gp671 [Bacillus phage G]|uniref:Gp671 n=1 Tax=Bacillus phage G TaxID=2884420 RepID=G3MB51_9CAUD|nr:gp671 [Bacillus phage G]AEO93914.1 gp671 [Bacillus phage G]
MNVEEKIDNIIEEQSCRMQVAWALAGFTGKIVYKKQIEESEILWGIGGYRSTNVKTARMPINIIFENKEITISLSRRGLGIRESDLKDCKNYFSKNNIKRTDSLHLLEFKVTNVDDLVHLFYLIDRSNFIKGFE